CRRPTARQRHRQRGGGGVPLADGDPRRRRVPGAPGDGESLATTQGGARLAGHHPHEPCPRRPRTSTGTTRRRRSGHGVDITSPPRVTPPPTSSGVACGTQEDVPDGGGEPQRTAPGAGFRVPDRPLPVIAQI